LGFLKIGEFGRCRKHIGNVSEVRGGGDEIFKTVSGILDRISRILGFLGMSSGGEGESEL
jgi:hypothetical protein